MRITEDGYANFVFIALAICFCLAACRTLQGIVLIMKAVWG